MKRILFVFMALAISLSLVGCSSKPSIDLQIIANDKGFVASYEESGKNLPSLTLFGGNKISIQDAKNIAIQGIAQVAKGDVTQVIIQLYSFDEYDNSKLIIQDVVPIGKKGEASQIFGESITIPEGVKSIAFNYYIEGSKDAVVYTNVGVTLF